MSGESYIHVTLYRLRIGRGDDASTVSIGRENFSQGIHVSIHIIRISQVSSFSVFCFFTIKIPQARPCRRWSG